MALNPGAAGSTPAREAREVEMWVAGCPGCGTVDLDSSWPRPELVHPRAWRCPSCLGAVWEPVAARLPA